MKENSLNIRKSFSRTAAAVLLLLAIFTAGPGSVTALAHTKNESIYLIGSWQKDEAGWRFLRQNSSYAAGQWAEYQDNSYYFMDNGYMASGWFHIGGHWYYFNPYEGKEEGTMFRGWIRDPEWDGWFYTNQNGIMVTGWHKIDGCWYYFNQSSDGVLGQMAENRVIDDAYVDLNGRMNELR